MNALLDSLLSRRSVRQFTSRGIDENLLQTILHAATQAPSAHNRQPWRFAILRGEEVRLRLADALEADHRAALTKDSLPAETITIQLQRSRARLLNTPVIILLCLDMSEMDSYPDTARQHNEYIMAVQSTALAGGNILLAAHALGLGGFWACAPLFTPRTVRQTLELPESWQPQAFVFLGYPAGIPAGRPRKPLTEVVQVIE